MNKKTIAITAGLCILAGLCFRSASVSAENTDSGEMQTGKEENHYVYELDIPGIRSEYVYLEDLDTGDVLIDRRSNEKMYPASITKMMTVILALEHYDDLDKTITITEEMLKGLREQNLSQAGFLAGDTPTVKDLLYGAVLPSGSDCVNALAMDSYGTIEQFVDAMNAKAKKLGMNSTHFANPTGIDDPDHYSTCRDISLLVKYCRKNDVFNELVRAETYTSTPVKSHPKGITMLSKVWKFVTGNGSDYAFAIPGFNGGKSGFTYDAGYTLASTASYNGMNLLLVNAKSYVEFDYPSHVEDASAIYNYAFDHLKKAEIIKAGDIAGAVFLKDSAAPLELLYPESLKMTIDKDQLVKVVVTLPSTLDKSVKKGDRLGQYAVFLDGSEVYKNDLICSKDVRVSNNPLGQMFSLFR